MRVHSVVAAISAALLVAPVFGQADEPKTVPAQPKPIVTLKVGSDAPAINVDAWVKGEPVTAIEKGNVYVIEFWATWCGPCKRVIPHLTDLQKAHPDVVIIGVAASERQESQTKDTRLDNLKAFVEQQGDRMGYRVAFESDRQMATEWLSAAGKNTIPTAFIVGRDGKIAAIGNPGQMDEALAKAIGDQPKKTGG